MDVVSVSPFRVGSVVWRPAADRWSLTIVCKGTFALLPGVMRFASEQEDVNAHDNYWDDDPQRSVYAPSDLAPFKPAPEVMLVGNAFAPRGEQVRMLQVRLVVGAFEKAIEVHGPRVFTRDDKLRPLGGFSRMPLRYERAAGGRDTWNPVGISADVPQDEYGQRPAPNLQPPGHRLARRGDIVPPVGFGPIAATWLLRREELGARAERWSDTGWVNEPLGSDFDGVFFQSSPPDQRLDAIADDVQITLDHLHPEHERLSTRLPGLRPRATVERPDGPPRDLALVADTLWIDTDRAICTVVWRGQVALSRPDQPGQVVVKLDADDAPLSRTSVGTPVPAEPPAPRPQVIGPGRSATVFVADQPTSSGASPLPFQLGVSAPPTLPADPAAPKKPPQGGLLTLTLPGHSMPDGVPRWVAAPASRDESPPPPAALPPPPQPVRASPSVPPPPPIHAFRSDGAVTPPSLASASDAALLTPMAPIKPAAPPLPDRVAPDVTHAASAAYAGVLAASNAATTKAAEKKSTIAEGAPDATSAASEVPLIEVLWFDPAAPPKLRKVRAWEKLLAPPPKKPAPVRNAPPPPPDPPEAAEDAARVDVGAVLARGATTRGDDLESAITAALGEGGNLAPPLVAVAGELTFPLDPTATLELVIATATPFAAGDKKLKETIDTAREALGVPSLPEPLESHALRVRDAWARANQKLPAAHLDATVERLLLEQRKYQKRELMDQSWIRALFVPAGEGAAIPAYLPVALAKRLPLYARFPARMLAEAVPQHDPHELSPTALRVLALARVITPRERPKSTARQPSDRGLGNGRAG